MKSFGDDDELWVSQGYTKNKNKNAIRQSHDYFSMNLIGRGHAQLISSNGRSRDRNRLTCTGLAPGGFMSHSAKCNCQGLVFRV